MFFDLGEPVTLTEEQRAWRTVTIKTRERSEVIVPLNPLSPATAEVVKPKTSTDETAENVAPAVDSVPND
ncbi:hypothetical protein FRUB_03673 [Fimbriiglobus ruber]|uniref:Uncharacterized protein n=1 Tax=Fimbriiglobus ruber TaxID=1908690 RepID=A0A225DZ24_9BACT|nr:hypothetical protein FRUB_03673 [Fimbriiglobus ruber]